MRIACVGTGYINAIHAQSCRNAKDVELAAVYSRREESGRSFAQKFSIPRVYTDYEQLLRDKQIDAVVIGLPTPLHKEFTVRAARAGKHILCEKPIALSTGDCEEMIGEAKKSDVIFMIGHVLRFWPEYVATKSVIDNGVMGGIRSLATYRLSAIPEWSSGNWLVDGSQSGGVPVDLQIHDIDFIRWMLGQPISLKSIGTMINSNFINSVVSTFGYEKAVAYSEAGYILPRNEKFKMGFRIMCEKGIIEYDNHSIPTLAMALDGKPFKYPSLSTIDPYTVQISYFIECVQKSQYPQQCPPIAALQALEIALKIKDDIL